MTYYELVITVVMACLFYHITHVTFLKDSVKLNPEFAGGMDSHPYVCCWLRHC